MFSPFVIMDIVWAQCAIVCKCVLEEGWSYVEWKRLSFLEDGG